jgi:hypothetical protein
MAYSKGKHSRQPQRKHAAKKTGTLRTLVKRVTVAFALGCAAGTVLASLGVTPAHAAVTATPAQEYAACHTAYQLRARQIEHAPVPSRAWQATWRDADHADPELRADIHRWMLTGRGWLPVRLDCNPDL